MRRLFAIFVLAAAVGSAFAVAPDTPDYRRLDEKAGRFFSNREWLNATAIYTLMLAQNTDDASLYSADIVSRLHVGDSIQAVAMLQTAMDHGVVLEDLLGGIDSLACRTGNATLYRDYLLQARTAYPWLTRTLNGYLLRYYDFRDDAPQIIRYAQIMLTGSPENLGYRQTLARGYLLDNQTEPAIAELRAILAADADNLQALLTLGNLYLALDNRGAALPLLRRAVALAPSPYLTALLRQ